MKTGFTYALALLLAMMLVGSTASHTQAAPAKQGATTWTVLAGTEAEMSAGARGPVAAWQIMKFYPDNITVNEGDTIVFKLNSAEIHNVIFPTADFKFPAPFIVEPQQNGPPNIYANPSTDFPTGGATFDGSVAVGSGQLGGPPTNPTEYKLTFSKAGDYSFYCSYHSQPDESGTIQGMVGKVKVQAAGSAYPMTQAQIDDAAKAKIASDQAEVVKGDAQMMPATASRDNSDGSKTYSVNVGGTNVAMGGDYMRFAPGNLTVNEGDSIEFVWKGIPHNAYFPADGKELDLAIPQPQPNGPPKILFNPKVMYDFGGNSFNGTDQLNFGVAIDLMPNGQPYTKTVKMTKAGEYTFICTFHANIGMVGKVTVMAKSGSSQPMMPKTGNGFDFTLVFATATLLLAAGLLLRRRMVQGA